MHYRAFMLDELQEATSAHTDTTVVETGSGSALLTRQGARLLGLFPSRDMPNVLWVNAAVSDLMAQGQWMVGGERLWIAPERNFYYENPRDFDGFHVPADIDPGTYEDDGELAYRNEFSLIDLSNNAVYDGAVCRRTFTAIEDPYDTGLPCAAMRIDDSVSTAPGDLEFCAWTLSMVYTCGPEHRGTALFPIQPTGGLLSYFDPIPDNRATVHPEGYARFAIDGESVYKLAIAPEDMVMDNPCRAVYLSPFPADSRWFCLVKRCADVPRSQDTCVDMPRREPEGTRGVIQSYNNGPTEGPIEDLPFGEIEVQLPKGAPIGDRRISAATHDVVAYAGSRDEMLEAARTALGISSAPELY